MVLGADNWVITESVASAVSAVVLLVGIFLAQRYGRRANTSLKIRLFPRAGGGLALEAKLEVSAVGLQGLRIATSDGSPPSLTVFDVTDDGIRFQYPEQERRLMASLVGQYASPGETVRVTELFHLIEVVPDQVGWQVEFSFEARRRIVRWSYVSWTETAFVPLSDWTGGTSDYAGGSDEDTTETAAKGDLGQGPGEGSG
jgi:hypothetical protein